MKIYYVRNTDNEKFACVAVVKSAAPGRVHRGVSICSIQDTFSKKIARTIATGRLCKAITEGRSGRPVQMDPKKANVAPLEFSHIFPVFGIVYKSAFDVEATSFELKLFDKGK